MPVRLPARLSEPLLRAVKRPMNAARAEDARAASVIKRSWGPGRRLFEARSRPMTDVHYLAFTPTLSPA